MPISFIQQKKKQKQLFLIVGIVLAITALVLWFGYFREPEESFTPPAEITSFVKDIKVDFEVLKNPFLKEFNIFEKIPPFEGEAGRKNPFLPY
jgi:Na+/melibiose symporter-like transporter